MRYDEINFDDDKLTDEERKRRDWEDENSVDAKYADLIGPYTLHIVFEDDTDATIDFENALRTVYTEPIFEPLLNPEYFAQVMIDDGQLVWPNGAKFKWAHIYKSDEHLAMIEGKDE